MKPAADNPVPVVILRSGHHGGLGIVRSLGRLGIPVYTVESTRWAPAFASRYCRGRFLMDLETESSEAAVGRLLQLAPKLGNRPILLPTTDQTCAWLAENARALRLDFRFPAQDAALVHTLCDKHRMQELARQHGLLVARSLLPRSMKEVVNFLAAAEFPVMVKETSGGRLRSRAGGTKFLVRSPRDLIDLYSKAGDPEQPNLIIQEFIPGEDWMFNGYFDANSRCLFGMTGRKIRRFPAKTGVTSLGVCVPNETVIQVTTDFMRAIGYKGILDIGFRRDHRDGQYKVLDVNPRIGCTFRLFAAGNGLDVARVLYLNLTGQPVPPAEFAAGRKWMVEDFDLFSGLRSWWAGALTCREWIGSLARVRETACFAADDPLPFIMIGLTDCCELFRWIGVQAGARVRMKQSAPAVPLASQRR